ncbi:tRNA (adenosine(37)-N6)-threonylcarbamoyltransferase complex dimerization subunit type 1 TsaB, partial [Limimaricola sp. ASW11-118]|nr:tRNA (adenosine(37)-N6)-threonylcarbamoyltransferase complex dimerization subunit type 1 TsaB [Limimaricola litoreus]
EIAHDRAATPQPRPAPLYVRPADAAPPRDPAPVLIG